MSVVKRRFRVTLTNAMVEGMDQLIEEGFFKDREAVFEGAISYLYRYYGMEPPSEMVEADVPSEL